MNSTNSMNSEDPVIVPIDGVLDLHTFNPKELPSLISDYLDACREKGIFNVRIVHGKGKGIQRARVHSLLARNPLVRRFRDASEEAGGWGATIVELRMGGGRI
jgi:DNA-nicking Smr family endonuclease